MVQNLTVFVGKKNVSGFDEKKRVRFWNKNIFGRENRYSFGYIRKVQGL